jgi:hypothetical protein
MRQATVARPALDRQGRRRYRGAATVAPAPLPAGWGRGWLFLLRSCSLEEDGEDGSQGADDLPVGVAKLLIVGEQSYS